MIPSITSLPSGYDCVVAAPVGRLGGYLKGGAGRVHQCVTVYADGAKIAQHDELHTFENGRRAGGPAKPYVWPDQLPKGVSGYLENSFRIESDEPLFLTNGVIPFYTIYNKPGKKSFFSDNAYLYASPPIIAQIAQYGQYIDCYPVVRLDRDRDYGESIIFINPYHRPLKARILAAGGRVIPNIRVPALSACTISLEGLMMPDERKWAGQIQITASNRVVTFDLKHSLGDPHHVSAHEHLDPYRGEPTHFPATRWLRLMLGKWLLRRGLS